MQDFFSSFGSFALDGFTVAGEGGASFALDIDETGSDVVDVNDIVEDAYKGGKINESVIDQAAADGKTSADGSVMIWENNENPVSSGTVNGLDFVIDTENATTGTTAAGTNYVAISLNNILGGSLTKAAIPASNPLTFSTGLTLAGLVGLAFSLASGKITGGSFTTAKCSITIGNTKNKALAYGDGYNSGTTTIATDGFDTSLTDANGNAVSAIFDIADSDTADVKSIETGDVLSDSAKLTVNGDYKFKLNGESFKLDNVDAAADIVFTCDGSDGTVSLDLSAVAAADGKVLNLATAGGADIVVPPTGETEIRIGGTTYEYVNKSGEAFFTLTDGKVDGFGFGDEKDAITIPKDAAFTLYEGDTDNKLNLGFSGYAEHTVTMTDEGYEIDVNFTAAGDFVYVDGTNDKFTLGTISANGNVLDVPDIEGDDAYSIMMTGADSFSIGGLAAGTVVTGDNMTITYDDDGGSVLFDAAGDIIGANGLEGTIALAAGEASEGFTINGATIITDEAIVVAADGDKVTKITGLETGDSITVIGGDDAVIEFTTNELGNGIFTVNGIPYTVTGDKNGVVYISGDGKEVSDLDSEATLNVPSDIGDITVNDATYTAAEVEVGDKGDGTTDFHGYIKKNKDLSAYEEDPAHPLITRSTWRSDIRGMLGIPAFDDSQTFVESEGDDLDRSSDTTTAEVIFDDDGTSTAKFNNLGKNLAIVTAAATGDKNIVLGDKGDAVIMDGVDEYGSVNITVGSGNDTIVVRGPSNEDDVVKGTMKTNIDMGNGGVDRIITYAAANANITLNNYDETGKSGVVIHDPEIPNIKNIREAIDEGLLTFEDGQITAIDRDETATGIDRKTTIEVNNKNSNHQTMVRLFGYKDNPDTYSDDYGQLVGFTGKNGGTLDASDIDEDLYLIGNKDSADNVAGSLLKSGAGDDVLFGGAGDTLDAGKGTNTVVLTDSDNRGAATVVIGEGDTTIENMNSGFVNGDIINMDNVDLTTASISFDGTNLTVEDKSQKFSATAEVSTAEGEEFVEQLVVKNGETIRAAIAQEGGTITVDGDPAPTYYSANGGAVDFSAYDGDVTVDIDGDWAQTKVGEDNATVVGASSLIGGSGNTLFKGGKADETLVAGVGESSLYGGGGKNVLEGQAGNPDKIGSTEFFVLGINNGAQNTITGFEFYDGSNEATMDVLTLNLDENDVTDVKANADGSVSIALKGKADGSTEKVTIEGAAGQEFLVDRGGVSESGVQIAANEVTVDADANTVDFYYASEDNATVLISDKVKSAKVWLDAVDHSDGVEFVGDFRVIDARGSAAEVELVGKDNTATTIYGGLGNASMWGGGGNANDVMYGGTGHNEFYFEGNNGNDTIMSANDGDIIHLGVTLDEIDFDNTNITSSGVEVKLVDGSTLTVNSTAEVTFSLDDGTTAKVNRATQQFE